MQFQTCYGKEVFGAGKVAVTRIWPIRGYARDVLNYIRNPEKTDMDLQNVLRYAVEGEKTVEGVSKDI